MLKYPTDIPSFKKSFQDVRALLVSATTRLARAGGPESANALREISRITQSLVDLEQAVTDQLKNRETQLGALMGIGRAINSSLGLNRVLEEVMDTLIELMRAERGFLMLRGSNGQLSVRIARGIDHINLEEEEFKVSRTIVERAAATGETILTTNAQEDPRFEKEMSVAAYQLRSILCAPLKLKNELIGVIYVDNRARSGIFQVRDQNLITAFCNQAAVAIDNAQLFDDLQDKNRELEEAYQATLEGWVSALDMRDKETEGHTQRVTVLTRRLARAMGVDDSQMIHITRGALLHDIGKMAISDTILLKRGALTEEERELMKQHPVFAYEMLKRIDFLLPAIDIPHYHHEKWDGTGYPDGLKGEEIPFAARIFPVVDVWDALTSNRPYRDGLPQDEVRERIKADSGKHFDPQVVEAFLQMDDFSV
ncbi:MAG TPA: HD domain-containing phosphohydrolase [Anaerolineales bacterium]|nr:HD domain-containing phosphohydrolase [Anaerolineales bacterium]